MKNTLTIIGLGSGNFNELTLEAYKILLKNDVWFRTVNHPCIQELKDQGYYCLSFDNFYDQYSDFETVYQKIVEEIINQLKTKDCYYAVPGNPLFHEKTVELLIEASKKEDFQIRIIPGISYLDRIADSLRIDLGNGTKIVDAYEVLKDQFSFDPNMNLLISEVWHKYYLGELKLKLMEFYPDETEIILIKHAGLNDEEILRIQLFELDRNEVDHLSSLFIPKVKYLNRNFDSLRAITAYLRSPDGCPWDRAQTHESLKRYLIEETYEVIDALDKMDLENLEEELGDLLFEILIHAQIASENNEFSIYDVIEHISNKMIHRHPHVFSDTNVDSVNQVLKNWDQIKKEEKDLKTVTEDMRGIPNELPALLTSDKIQHKARKVGFDWDDAEISMEKVVEEVNEVLDVFKNKEGQTRLEEELGDLLFATVNVLRLSDIDPEEALRMANRKFIDRFELMENEVLAQDKELQDLTLEELEKIWIDVKKLK